MPDTETRDGIPPSAVATASAGAVADSKSTDARVRVLPNGEFQPAQLRGWNDRCVEIEFSTPGIVPGQTLEIESGDVLYWGELQTCAGTIGMAFIENSLDRAMLAKERTRWD